MSALVHESPDRAVKTIRSLAGGKSFASWKHLTTFYLKARKVKDVMPGDLQRPNCLFKKTRPITADINPLVEPHRSRLLIHHLAYLLA